MRKANIPPANYSKTDPVSKRKALNTDQSKQIAQSEAGLSG